MKGTLTSDPPLEQRLRTISPSFSKGVRSTVLALVYLILRRLFGLTSGSGSDNQSKDLEILVLRHQLRVLHRQKGGGIGDKGSQP